MKFKQIRKADDFSVWNFPFIKCWFNVFIKYCMDQRRRLCRQTNPRQFPDIGLEQLAGHIGWRKGRKEAKILGEESWDHNETLRCYIYILIGSRGCSKAITPISDLLSLNPWDSCEGICHGTFYQEASRWQKQCILPVLVPLTPPPPALLSLAFKLCSVFLEVGFYRINSLLLTSLVHSVYNLHISEIAS